MPPSPISLTASEIASPRTRRLLGLVVAVALALALLAAPQFTSPAAARLAHTEHTAKVFARTMLKLLNKERASHHLRRVTMNTKLIKSAHRHNLAMARHNEMSHQCPGEKFFADRITAVHYKWLSAGENIGWNSQMSRPGLRYLEREMYHEKAPDNGHRLNILDKSFRNIGIDVYFDKKHHKMWFTQDFGQPA